MCCSVASSCVTNHVKSACTNASTVTPVIKRTVSNLQALSDRDYEASPSREQEVMIDGNGLVTICPNLGYYEHLEEQSPLTQDGTITASDAEYSGHQYVQMQVSRKEVMQ